MAIMATTNGLLVAERHGLADERAELQLVLDELRREGGAVAELADILGAVDDDEVALLVEEAGIAGLEPAVGASRCRASPRPACSSP